MEGMNSREKKLDYSNMALEVVNLQNVLLFPPQTPISPLPPRYRSKYNLQSQGESGGLILLATYIGQIMGVHTATKYDRPLDPRT